MNTQSLRRDLGLLDAVGIGLGAIIGAGIFVVTGIAAGIAGPAIFIAFLIAGVAATANALSSAALAAEYPQAGGTYEYGYQVLSPWAGFAAGWMFLGSKIAAAGTVALGLAGYLSILIPGLQPRVIAVGAIVIFTFLNYLGIQKTSRANLIVVACSLGVLVGFVVIGISHVQPAHFQPLMPEGGQSLLQAAALLFFAYTGYARVATLGEEVREPEKTIPRAIIITIVVASLLYVLVAFVAVGTAGAPALANSSAPLAVAANTFHVRGAVPVIAVGAIAAMLGVILSQLLALSRMVFAMGRRGDFPRVLAFVDPRSGVPSRAVLTVGAIAAIITTLGGLRAIATAASFTILVYYGITNLAVLRSPVARSRYGRGVPVAGLSACLLLAFSLPLQTVALGLVILAGGLIVRFVAIGVRPK